ncbi:MAG: ABC transporter substrate-binding protein [Cyclobacteriaceae bacterium]
MKHLSILILLLICGSAWAQTDQAQYLEAKRLYKEKQYSSAKASFGALSESAVFGDYSRFYFGLSAYHQGDLKVAMDTWKELLQKSPRWEHSTELYYWLARASYENNDISGGLKYGSMLTEQSLNSGAESYFIDKYISSLSLDELEELFDRNSDNRFLASIVVSKLNDVSYSDRDFDRMDSLRVKFDLKPNELASESFPLIKKDTYDIAVLLPFLFSSLENTSVISQNKFVMDMYQGMQLAAEDLTAGGYPTNLYPYDTKRRKDVTKQLLNESGFENHDLMIGPLFPGPIEAADEFSINSRINKVNPISSNSEALGENPYSFLIRPTYETMAKKMAEFAATENDNSYAMVFYEQSDRDSLFATKYKESIESAGYEVVLFQPITKDNSRDLLDGLWSQYDDYLTQEMADSIMEADPTRFIKNRRIRTDEMERMEKDTSFVLPISFDEDEHEIVYYEKLFNMAPDSIGHIVAATRSNLFANNLISAIETRGDSIKLYGYGDWLDFTMLSYSQLERLQVGLTNPDYADTERLAYEQLRERLSSTFKTEPSINHFRGYETVYFAGMMMHRQGKYFQTGLREGAKIDGKVNEGYKYGSANDNQIVPIIRFKESKLEVVNRANYENGEK